MTYFCKCGHPMNYIIPNDESTPPRLECPSCGYRMAACGEDHAYTSSALHVYLKR